MKHHFLWPQAFPYAVVYHRNIRQKDVKCHVLCVCACVWLLIFFSVATVVIVSSLRHRENMSTQINTEQRKAVSFCKPHCKSSTNKRFLPGSVKPPPVHGVDLVKTRLIYCTFKTGSGHATPAAPLPPLTPPPHHLCESHRMHTHLHTSSCTKSKTTYHTCFYSFTPQCPTNHQFTPETVKCHSDNKLLFWRILLS